MKSPCIGCDFEHEDKNTERCTNCEKRIKYAEDELMIPQQVLKEEAEEEYRERLDTVKDAQLAGYGSRKKLCPCQ